MKNTKWLFLILTVLSTQAWADMTHPWRDEDSKKGYTENVSPDQEESGEILYTIDDPYKNEIKLKDRLFDQKLSKEISSRYYEKFGRTEAEIIQDRTPYLNTNFTEGQSLQFTQQDYQAQQRSFGEYVIRRVGEYQFDQQAKTNPDIKKIQNVKEKVENVSFFDAGGFKLRANYKLAANTITLKLVNPFALLSVRDEIADHQRVIELSKDLGKGYSFVTDYYLYYPTWDLVGKKYLSSNLSLTFTFSPFHHFDYSSPSSGVIYNVSETRYIAGVDYKF